MKPQCCGKNRITQIPAVTADLTDKHNKQYKHVLVSFLGGSGRCGLGRTNGRLTTVFE